ncbi:Zn-dependent exopeptidase [Violaceomyces palustris]|uniref:Zn-dependent exopeptidase n=1 Tax=Violaceomyces palustris TaxID=1673888 RepID=A0ACD0P5U3_9BASI|nr:Zn-dependent exopeptidase [Violaceomyces palustris]
MPPIPLYSRAKAVALVEEQLPLYSGHEQQYASEKESYPAEKAARFSDEDLADQDRIFTKASKSSRRHRLVTAGFLAAFAGIYVLLFGTSLPDFRLPAELRQDGLGSNLGFARPCPHAVKAKHEIEGYEKGMKANPKLDGEDLKTEGLDLDKLSKLIEQLYLKVPTADGAREALKRYTSESHVAGTDGDYRSAVNLLEEWADLLDIEIPSNLTELVFDAGSPESVKYMTEYTHARAWTDTYSVWLNYPINSSLTLSAAPTEEDPNPEPHFVASMKEDVLDEDPTSGHGVPVFHGYSRSGSATGQIVYAGMGRKEDFEGLAAKGIDLKGKIVLVTYGGVFRGLKVRAAQEAGAIACLIYSDPVEDGSVTIANGYEPYPKGPARNPSAVQRGSVQALSFYPGDPATPGKPSYRNATRLDPDEADSLPKIPSLPISYQDALPLLQSLKGKGVLAAEINDRFPGALPDVEYWTGPSEEVAHVENYVDMKVRDIWNTYAVIPGFLKDEVVVIGNHRDAWTFGAGDPSSGTAAFHEVVKGLGTLYKKGWRPLRTILIASWDAEEYGLVGSTEFGEDYAEWLREKVVAYHNVDVAVSGSELSALTSPSLAGLISDSAREVDDPLNAGQKISLDANHPVGSGSDFTVFLQHLGIASTNIGYQRQDGDPVYHYHSNYDSFAWMDKFSDPGFKKHVSIAQILGVATLRTAQPIFVPINVTAYAEELEKYLVKVEQLAVERKLDGAVDLDGLKGAIKSVQKAAAHLDSKKERLSAKIEKLLRNGGRGGDHLGDGFAISTWRDGHYGKDPRQKIRKLLVKVRQVNKVLREFEQGFIDKKGLVGREWYKHIGVAPGRWLGYGSTTFPGLTEAITLDGGKGAQFEVRRLEKHLLEIAKSLRV